MKKRIVAIVTAALAALFMFTGCSKSYNWNEVFLADKFPKPDSGSGEIMINTKDSLSMHVTKVPAKNFYDYIEKCKESGYSVECEEDDISFDAFNQEGYKIKLVYYRSSEEMSLSVDAPEKLGVLDWPESEMLKLIPKPDSNVGKINSNSESFFVAYVGDTSIEKYNEYVKKCSDAGFIVDYDKGDKFYYAKNIDGYSLALKYEGNKVMFVRIEKIKEENSNESSSTSSESISSTTESSSTPESSSSEEKKPELDSGLIRPEVKEALESYEAFVDEYVEFMKKYNSSGNQTQMMTEYLDYINKLVDFENKIAELDDKELTTSESAYYSAVMLRCADKMLKATS